MSRTTSLLVVLLVGFRVKLDGDDAFIAVHGGAQSMAAEGLVRRGQSDFHKRPKLFGSGPGPSPVYGSERPPTDPQPAKRWMEPMTAL